MNDIVPRMIVLKNADIWAKIRNRPAPFVRNPVLALWPMLARLPFGKFIANFVLGSVYPLFGTIGCWLDDFRPMYAAVLVGGHWRVKDSLGEVDPSVIFGAQRIAASLAMAASIDSDLRPILMETATTILQRPIGLLKATCFCVKPGLGSYENLVHFTDQTGAVVAQGKCSWEIRVK